MEKRPHRARRATRRARHMKKLRKRAAQSDRQQKQTEHAQSGSRNRGPTEKRLGKRLPSGSRLVSIKILLKSERGQLIGKVDMCSI